MAQVRFPRRSFIAASLAAAAAQEAGGASPSQSVYLIGSHALGLSGIGEAASLTFYDSGTFAKRPVFTSEAMLATHPNPLVVEPGTCWPHIHLDSRYSYRCVVRDSLGNVIDDIDPYQGLSSLGVLFTQTGENAVPRTLQARERERISVLDFVPVALHTAIANGTSRDDLTGHIQTALSEAQRVAYAERVVEFPAGRYCVTQISLRDRSFLTMMALGTVQITGIDGSSGFIVGDDRYDRHGHTENFTRNVRMAGGPWLIGPAPGQAYARGLKLQNVKDSIFENVSVSGEYGSAKVGEDRKAVELELSFDNAFYNCSIDLPGPPAWSRKSYGLWLGSDNVNNNRFYNFRCAGLGHTVARTVGVRADSLGNTFYGGDISAVHTCFELNAARGTHAISLYHEAVGRIVDVIYASEGCVFMPNFAEVMAGPGGAGTAYNLGGPGSIETVGFQILGGLHKFSGPGTIGVAKGENCYGLTYQPGTMASAMPATPATGRDAGSGGTALIDAFELTTAKLSFPDHPIPSSGPTTLDAYKEGTWTPVYRGVTLLGPGGKGKPVATYTKIGNKVWLSLRFSVGEQADDSVRQIGGIPYEIADDLQHGMSIGHQVNPNRYTFRMGKSGNETYLVPIDPADGTDRAPRNLSNTEFALEICYTAKY